MNVGDEYTQTKRRIGPYGGTADSGLSRFRLYGMIMCIGGMWWVYIESIYLTYGKVALEMRCRLLLQISYTNVPSRDCIVQVSM